MTPTDRMLRHLAKKHGIDLFRPSASGERVPISAQTVRSMASAMGIAVDAQASEPLRCHLPDTLAHTRCWGISLQLYELRSQRNWGIGDFCDLWGFCQLAGRLGADFIGLNPLHAPFMADPGRCSPYEPSNRRYLNPLYIAVDQVEGFEITAGLEDDLRQMRETELVDYVGVSAAKLGALREIWKARSATRSEAFQAFLREGGEGLRLHAVFEAISQAMVELGQGASWSSWPAAYKDRKSNHVKEFVQARPDDIEFHMWLQWLAHEQLGKAADEAEKAGLRLGLYLDLAVGEALDGSATWSDPDIYLSGASVGNPPEPFATDGQDWRLAALLPTAIADGDNSPFKKMISAAMRYAGAIRIDHAAALARLFLVPAGQKPEAGAYVSYPQEELLLVLAKASNDNASIVIGEDLGNIPDGLQSDLAESNVLSYRILSYEQTDAGFIVPQDYPVLALACVSTHDHQTFAGWWRSGDIDLRAEHALVDETSTQRHRDVRLRERATLVDAFEKAGIAPAIEPDQMDTLEAVLSLSVAAHRYVARSPSLLVSVRLADLTDEPQPTNVPGTSASYPNWRPKLSIPLEDLADHPVLQAVVTAIKEERPRHTGA